MAINLLSSDCPYNNNIFRGNTISAQTLAEMEEADKIKRLIRDGQCELSEDIQRKLLKLLTGKVDFQIILECRIYP